MPRRITGELHADVVLEQCRQLQDHARELRESELQLRTRERTWRLVLLTITALALWLSALIALLEAQQ